MPIENELFSADFSPIQELRAPLFRQKKVCVWAKRDDLIRPQPSGNKWRKLKYNLLTALAQQHDQLLTFGGAFSNHIYATAAAGKHWGLRTIGIIRGERPASLNPTLAYAEICGMSLHFIDRSSYRNKYEPDFLAQLQDRFGRFYFLPEGGTNTLALRGCAEVMTELYTQLPHKVDYVMAACGTGGTLAGLIQGAQAPTSLVGISVLKGDFLTKEVERHLQVTGYNNNLNWTVRTDYHHGGYAKYTTDLIRFINDFRQKHGIALDPIYTGKLFYAAWDMVVRDCFSEGSHLVLLHTGGLQGIAGFNARFGDLIEVGAL